MAMLNGSCEDSQVKEAVENRLIAAEMEGKLWYHNQMQRMELE